MRMARIAIFGASGLIGGELAERLAADGFDILAVARRFAHGGAGSRHTRHEIPFIGMDVTTLANLLAAAEADVVVNCVGVLQGTASYEAHVGFAARLSQACHGRLLIHLSIPNPAQGTTDFSRTKAAAEAALAASDVDRAVLRPGFVVAQTAYGGSALMRALAATGLGLPTSFGAAPLMTTAVADIAATVATLARRWRAGERGMQFDWDVMSPEPLCANDLLDAFRARLAGPPIWLRLPHIAVSVGALAGDFAGLLGWRPPTRTTAVEELRRGISGKPETWMRDSGLTPRSLRNAMLDVTAAPQDRWFARLYLWKGTAVAVLALFWIATGLIALTAAREQSVDLMQQAVPAGLSAGALATLTSLLDISLGCAIAVARTSQAGLISGIALTLVYLLFGSLLSPHLWLDPLGAYTKDLPMLLAMVAALAVSRDR
ncbi:MAG TPA: SDR family oxidoreductase [Beijerinckiaceae bacterium]|nr:SDR family oxidoreductase [Rhodoblastus sp.]MCB1533333.1 SDR family oxidoreductase [Rhodoblastus sp.]HRY01513.1 SDR family oxidoreductase [Beijerinckiaceae bacterium]